MILTVKVKSKIIEIYDAELLIKQYLIRKEQRQIDWSDFPENLNLTSFRMVSSSEESNIVEYNLAKELDKKGTEEPITFALPQNYPNPFNPSTNISFSLPEPEQVIINVYDVLGRLITSLVNQKFEPGKHNVSFDPESPQDYIFIE